MGFTLTPCLPWCEVTDLPCADVNGATDPDVAAAWVDMASEWLAALTGFRFGVRTTTFRPPCAPNCRRSPCPVAGLPLNTRGEWSRGAWVDGAAGVAHNCVCGTGCECPGVSEYRLPYGPVCEIVSITLDGDELTEGLDFTVVDGQWLMRLDGQSWPSCQPLDLEPGMVGTWQVEYTWGVPPPRIGELAAAQLACEIGKGIAGDAKCALPKSLVGLTRQGVSAQFRRPSDDQMRGLTGVGGFVDAFIRAYNPNGLTRRPRVLSPDVQRRTYSDVTFVRPWG